MSELNEKQLLIARREFNFFMTVGEKDFPKLKLNTPLDFFKTKMNKFYEELGCVGFNPAFNELTAVIKIKKETGYSGSLCTKGSFEYVRFYLDYNDGSGWNDMGFTAFNAHDIPTQKDCDSKPEKPIDYVVRLKIKPKQDLCVKANLPKVKAVLSWNSVPAPNDPNLTTGSYVWGDVKEEYIQISPIKFFIPNLPLLEVGSLFEKALLNPEVSLNDIAATIPEGDVSLKKAKKEMLSGKVDFQELANTYRKKKIEPYRFGYKLLKEAGSSPDYTILNNVYKLFESNKLSFVESLGKLNKLKCNTTYEELFCVGADYNQEALIGTLKVKKSAGYNGDLCKDGSREYVSFWIQEEDNCSWEHAGTTSVNVHDIASIPRGGLSYSVILPYDFSKFKRKCNRPRVLKVRAILSWNVPPSGMECSHWGNIVESYIQIKPGMVWTANSPKLITVGGVSTDNINNFTGLTLPGAKIEFNQTNTFNGSPFGGIIVVQGVSAPFAGMKYKVKITNLTTGGSYYLNNKLALLGYNPATGIVTHPVEVPVSDEYTYQPYYNNIDSVLARFSPGTNDKLLVTIENQNGTSDSQVIQMDNTFPAVSLTIDDQGNCSHYAKGDTIHGEFTVDDNYLERYSITTNAGTYTKVGTGLGQSGTTTGSGQFNIVTFTNRNCGSIYLKAIQKTIWNSVKTGTHSDTQRIICLSE
ncbi:hypothetical protein GM418_12060 [Maribellus comscasis]|uniref:Uncharacterized protein n=1 Tax=Maribellus comscasis TaxID=2681766 RepID=A0A6I6JYZ1_9BACT|nr:hypothetical protein [Maribellus comscasis]QGY44363.1 hypothetical protein GM418_12060 [Maribellus comscasis]